MKVLKTKILLTQRPNVIKREKKGIWENVYNLKYQLNPKPNGLAFVVHLGYRIGLDWIVISHNILGEKFFWKS